jgi:release factor glutamine methyltransferase
MRSVRAALAEAERRLAAIPGNPRQDAELLMAHAKGVSLGELHLRHLDDDTPPAFGGLLRRRLAREPVAYIVGQAGFWTVELEVGPGALIPRADTETLMAAAVDHFGRAGPARILDLGTGPGTLLLAALDQWPRATGIGIDASQEALGWARRNADRLGVADRASFANGHWAHGITEAFDLVLCNPPYIEQETDLDLDVAEWEPHGALFAGPDGLDAYRLLAGQVPRLVAPGGLACIEIGQGQEEAVRALFAPGPFTISSRRDLRAVVRCLVLSRG